MTRRVQGQSLRSGHCHRGQPALPTPGPAGRSGPWRGRYRGLWGPQVHGPASGSPHQGWPGLGKRHARFPPGGLQATTASQRGPVTWSHTHAGARSLSRACSSCCGQPVEPSPGGALVPGHPAQGAAQRARWSSPGRVPAVPCARARPHTVHERASCGRGVCGDAAERAGRGRDRRARSAASAGGGRCGGVATALTQCLGERGGSVATCAPSTTVAQGTEDTRL